MENKKDSPTFFMISNLGGGGSDKYREISYTELHRSLPELYNYDYLTMHKYPGEMCFATKYLKSIDEYKTFLDFINHVEKEMINTDKYFSLFHEPPVIYSNRKLLLDSGAANIINRILKKYDITTQKKQFLNEVSTSMTEYYDFADRYKFDIVIGFDTGGKYTFKGEERSNEKLKSGNAAIKKSSFEINRYLLIKTVEYIKNHENYHPKIYATVHGTTPEEYKRSIEEIIQIEKENNISFDGYALGGVASSKGLDVNKWFLSKENIQSISNKLDLEISASTEFNNAAIATCAVSIVKKYAKNKPIHVLGGGGKMNIVPLYLAGASSFDCQTPARRAYDGSGKDSYDLVFDKNYKGSVSFSKYLIPKIKSNGLIINNELDFDYEKINTLDDSITLCDCPACNIISSISKMKKLYSMYNTNTEDYYLSRQIMNCHGIWQHVFLCNVIQGCTTIDDVENKLNAKFPYMNEWKVIMKGLYPLFIEI